MKILLLGEMSGFYTTLKAGLLEFGHDVYLMSNGDGYKNFPADYRWDTPHKDWPRLFRGIHTRLRMINMLKMLSGYDVVMATSFTPLCITNISVNKALFAFLKKNNGKVYVSGAALSETCCDYWLKSDDIKLKKYLQLDFDEIRNGGGIIFAEKERKLYCGYEDYILSLVDGYIPVMFEYDEPYKGKAKLKKSIPLPINVDSFDYHPNKVENKIIFFNGKTRRSKGGEYVEAAFNRLRLEHSDKAVFIREGGLTFNEYEKLVQNSNVIIDNINNHSFGMNQLLAMLQGRVVMGGNDRKGGGAIYKEEPPTIELLPDIDNICNEIEKLIDNVAVFEELGWKSRQFVINNHDYRKVAKQYLDLWNE